MKSSKKALLPGYLSAMEDVEGKKRYLEKIRVIGGLNPYETPRRDWQDDVDLWPSVSSVHIAGGLIL